jgi:hypothetical protein
MSQKAEDVVEYVQTYLNLVGMLESIGSICKTGIADGATECGSFGMWGKLEYRD